MRHELSGRVIERVACTPERSTTGARARSAAGKPHNCSAMDRASQAGKGTPNPGAFLRTPVEKRRCSREHDVHGNKTATGCRARSSVIEFAFFNDAFVRLAAALDPV